MTLALLGGTGCVEAFGNDDPHDPGTSLGTFHLSATQSQNSCGDGALGAPVAWEFDVQLAWEDDSLFWNSGGDVLVGTLSSDRTSFQIATSVVMDMRTEEDAGLAPCSVRRDDIASGSLAVDGETVTSFAGTLSYGFTATDGSDCTDLVTPVIETQVPVFAALPCSMKYSFQAPRTGE